MIIQEHGDHLIVIRQTDHAVLSGYFAHEAGVVNDFLQRLRLQQWRLKVDLRGEPTAKNFAEEKWVQANAQRLEALDRLSLYFCLGPVEPATIDAVAADYKGKEVDWDLQPEENDGATLEPYPFRRDPLEISILARRIPKRRYADDLDLQRTLAQAPYFGQKFTLRAGGTRMQARVASL